MKTGNKTNLKEKMKKYLALVLPIMLLTPAIMGPECVAPGPGANKPNPNPNPNPNDPVKDCYPGGAPACGVMIYACAAVTMAQEEWTGWVAGPDTSTVEKCLQSAEPNAAIKCEFNRVEDEPGCSPSKSIDWEISCQDLSTGEWWLCAAGTTDNASCDETGKENIGEQVCNVWTNQNWFCKYTIWNCK